MIQLDNVNLYYEQSSPILSNVSLYIPQGSFCWLTGSSGVGKSTLLRMFHLEIKPNQGHIQLLDTDILKSRRSTLCNLKQRISIIYQDFKLIPNLTIYDNIALPLRLQNMDETIINRWTNRILQWMNLQNKTRLHPKTLSGGEQQRIAIARAIINRPDILLADEPTNALDEEQVLRLMDLFYDLNDLGCTIIIATHNDNLIRQFPAPKLKLEKGQIKVDDAIQT